MRRLLPLLAVCITLLCFLFPSVSFTEDKDTVTLARVIYAAAREESYETKLAVGTVVMNRVSNAWFPRTLDGVLNEQMQFARGTRYDPESLRAAHEVLAGRRVLAEDALYYLPEGSARSMPETALVGSVGSYRFYSDNGSIF